MNEQVDYRSVIDRLVESGQLRDAAPATPAAPVAPVAPAVPIAPAAPMVPSTPPSGRTVDDYRAAIQQLPSGTFEAAPSGAPVDATPPLTAAGALRGETILTRPGPTVDRLQATRAAEAAPGPTRDRAAALETARALSVANQLLSAGASPDTVARVRRISRDEDLPLPLAADTYVRRVGEFSRAAHQRLLEANPGLRALVGRRGYADLLEDADRLAAVEQSAQTLRRFILPALPSPLRDAVDLGLGAVQRTMQIMPPEGELTVPEGLIAGLGRGAIQMAANVPYMRAMSALDDITYLGLTEEQILERLAVDGFDLPYEDLPEDLQSRLRVTAREEFARASRLTDADVAASLNTAAERLATASSIVDIGERLGRSAQSQAFTQYLSQQEDTVAATLRAFADRPAEGAAFLAETLAESGSAIIGAAIIGRLTGSAGIAAAFSGFGSFSRENVNSAMEYIAEQGYEIRSVEDAAAVLGNAELIAEAERRGLTRGVIIGVLDALAGAVAAVPLSQNPLADVLLQSQVQAGLGAGGEVLGSLAATGEVSAQAATIEYLAELPSGLIDVPAVGLRELGRRREEVLTERALNELLGQDPNTAQARAEAALLDLETTRAAIEETRTFARDPDAVRELLQEAGDQEVTIPAAEIDRLYQEGTLTDADIEYLQVEEELTQQGELSGDVAVAASRLLTLEGESFSALVDNVRVRPDALTVAEARDAIANREADIERLQATLQQAQAEVTEVADLARRVADDLAQAAPQYTAGQRGAMGRLLAERYAARAALFGPEVTAQTLYAADRVTFQRQAAPGTQALEQTPLTDADVAYNEQVRTPAGLLDRDTVLPGDNILYRPDRAYRFIGEAGYADFLESGQIRAAQGTKKGYEMPYFMRGKSSSRYGRGDSGAYMVEAIPSEEGWRADEGASYTGPLAPLTREDRIRVYRRLEDGTFEVILDNIGDRALLTQSQAAPGAPGILEQGPRESADTGVETGVPLATRLSAAFQLAQSRRFRTGRELKLELQEASRAAQAEAGVDLTTLDEANIDRLADFVFEDALEALTDNANAIGWYDRTVTAALEEVASLHPEILSDPARRLQFTWALAVTSNGLKVNKNFELALDAYEALLASEDQRFPAKIGIGTAATQIDGGLAMYGQMLDRFNGDHEALAEFMNAQVPVRDLEREFGVSISGEGKGELVRGASILGPKIGNGFFANLYGNFDALTMDRWLMRTVGRWRGTLVFINEPMVNQKRGEIRTIISGLSQSERRAISALLPEGVSLRARMTAAQIDSLATAAAKESAAPAWRTQINALPGGEGFRRASNALFKYLDGQVEAPAGARERAFLREVFQRGLNRLQQAPEVRRISNQELTMSDLQALLWYPEKRLYDTAKQTEGESRGYEDDEAPDYANAAREVVRARTGGADRSAGRTGRAGRRAADDGRGVGTAAEADQPLTLEQPAEGPQTPERGQVGAPRGAYILPKRDGDANVFQFTASADPSTFVHEVGHMFLYQMVRDLSDARLSETGRAQLEQQIRATRSWFRSNSEQAYSDLGKLAKDARRRASRLAAGPEKEQANLRALRLEAAYNRARQGGGAAYMQQVANAFLDPSAQGYDEAAEVVFHELWARGFEKYLGSGSAPSAALRTVFARFAKYIANVYRSLRQLNVEISPEVADVFDRLLATDAAIAEVRRGSVYRLSPGVLDGATPNEAQELRRLAAEAETEAMTQIARREQNALNQKARAQRAARREQLTADITEQVAAEPVYAAITLAQTGVLPNGENNGTGKLARTDPELANGVAARLPRSVVAGRRAPDNPIAAGTLATLSGFDSVGDMIDALSNPNLRRMQDEVRARVDEQMQAEFGAETDPANLSDEAMEAAQNTRFQELQRLQLRILRRLAAEPLARVARRQAEQVGAPAAAADQAAEAEARAEEAAATSPREAVQANLARIRAQVQRQANVPQRRAQAAAGRQTRAIQRNVDPAVIQEAARRYVQSIEVRQATPARYQQTANRMSLKIERAIAARDYAQAADLMEQRALNLAIAREAADVQAMITKQRRRWRDLTGRADRRLAQSYDVDWVNAIRLVLEPLGFGRRVDTNYSAEQALAAMQAVEPTLAVEIRNQINGAVNTANAAAQEDPKQPHRALTVERLTEILDLADQLLANARNTHGMLLEGRRVSFDRISTEAQERVDMRRDVARREARQGPRASAEQEKWVKKRLGFGAWNRRVADLARDLDNGDPRGPFTLYVVRPIQFAESAFFAARREPIKRLAELLNGRRDLMRDQRISADELAPGFEFRNKGELIMAIAQTGSESGMRKLLTGGGGTGRQWSAWTSTQNNTDALDTSRWDAFFNRAITDGTITKADMDLVQGVFDIFKSTLPGAQAAHKKMFGYRFTELDARPIVTPFGIYEGGYVPAVQDRFANPSSDKFDDAEAMSQQANASMFPGPERGFTVARTDATYVLDLDIGRLPAHFDRVMKFTHLGPVVQQVGRLINHRPFRAQLDRVNSEYISTTFIPWLQRVARQQVATPSADSGGRRFDDALTALQRRVGSFTMAGNVVNAAEQMFGLFPALTRLSVKDLLAASATWKHDDVSARRHMLEVSPLMRERLQLGVDVEMREVNAALTSPSVLRSTQEFMLRYSYILQQGVANIMEPTIWLAAEREAMRKVYPQAYSDALAATGDDAQANATALKEVYAYADNVVESTQGSTRPGAISSVEGGTPGRRLLTQFLSFFNAMGNNFTAEKNIALNSEMGWFGRMGRVGFVYLAILYAPAVASELLRLSLSGELDELDEMDDEELWSLGRQVFVDAPVKFALATVPLVGPFAAAAYGRTTSDPYDDQVRGAAAVSVAGQVGIDGAVSLANLILYAYRGATGGDNTEAEVAKDLRQLLSAIGLSLGLPNNWLARPARYAERVREGEADPEGMVDIIQGILTGRDGTED